MMNPMRPPMTPLLKAPDIDAAFYRKSPCPQVGHSAPTRRGRAAVTSSHFDYGLTEALTREHAVERCWQVLQPFCDVGLELHSSVREGHFEFLAHLRDQMLPG